MAQFTGFYSGLKEGRETSNALSLQALQRRQAEQKIAQEELAAQERQKTKQILSQAYSANSPTRMNDSYEEFIKQTANTTEQAAKDVMGINPEVGMSLLKQSQDERKRAFEAATNSLELKKKQLDVAGQIGSQVADQQSLDDAIVELSKVGTVVPERYRVWSPETKEWFGRRAMASENFLKSMQLANTSERVRIEASEAASKQEDRLAKQRIAERKEQLARDKIEIARKQYKPSKDEARMVKSELKLLADSDERFDSLASTQQDAAAKDVRYLKSAYMAEDPSLSEDLALQRARRAVIGRITPEGGYPVIGAEETTQSAQTRIFNGVEYVKVPGGWKRKQ